MRTTLSLALALGLITAVTIGSPAGAQQAFMTPEEAGNALIAALRAADAKAVARILGPGSAEIISSGDKVEDETLRKRVLAQYDAKHSISKNSAGQAFMVVGNDDYPLPLPIVEKGGNWRFDAMAGREEILYRRIGRNELAAIQVCLAYVDAQNEYAEMGPTGRAGEYAQRIISSPGKKDGLYWPATQGEAESPIGEEVAAATLRGYRIGGERAPYHGYYYKILSRQGPTARGGAANYVVNGKMTLGFALVAYPAQYGNSGVMTFLVNHEGDVFQKDLGPRTAELASRMTAYGPDHTWSKVVETQEQK